MRMARPVVQFRVAKTTYDALKRQAEMEKKSISEVAQGRIEDIDANRAVVCLLAAGARQGNPHYLRVMRDIAIIMLNEGRPLQAPIASFLMDGLLEQETRSHG